MNDSIEQEQVVASADAQTEQDEMLLMEAETSSEFTAEAESVDDEESSLPLSAQVASLLFSTSRPISLAALCRIVEREERDVENAIAEVRGLFDGKVHGFALFEVAGGYQFRTDPEATPLLRRLLPLKTRRLSKAAAETLAVIAYKQPVQRAEIESIRGVDALPTLKTLIDQKLVRVIGHDTAIGQPTLYGTTDYFLERFGLKDLSSLPTERDLLVLEDEPGEDGKVDGRLADEISVELEVSAL